jgi:protein-L-isoaspartate(D-aspartate) O-methyltransferase
MSPSFPRCLQVHADGRLGLPAHATYDCIHVGAASPSLPVALMEQLNVGGRLVVPEGAEGEMQYLNVYDKVSDDPDAPNHGVKKCKATAVRYVPLTDESSQRGQSW